MKEKLWIVEALNLSFTGDVSPGIDIVATLKDPNGIEHEMFFSFGITWDFDTPRVAGVKRVMCKLTVDWDESHIIDGILFSFRLNGGFPNFLRDLSSHIGALVKFIPSVNVEESQGVSDAGANGVETSVWI